MPDSLVDAMSLEEQLGQLLMAGFHGTTPSPQIIDLLARRHVGGVILFSRNIQDASQLLALTQSLQKIAREAGQRLPLLIAVDQENGMVSRLGRDATSFPGNMALGALADERVTYEVARATGNELRALGINMNLAPVVDVNNNPANPVIGVRSFGEEPSFVARHAAAAIRGYAQAGVIATLKHFPGHGDTTVDSHLALPSVPASEERLAACELLPFTSGIQAGAPAVMTAHIYLPAIMQGEALPATLSPAVVQGLLRARLDFDGVIVSDCMEMSAITHTVGSERGTLMALQAGHDLVLISHTYARQAASLAMLQAAVVRNELPTQAIRRAAERVLRLKRRFLSWEAPRSCALAQVGGAFHRQLSDNAYTSSTTLLRNQEGLIPLRLKAGARIFVLSGHAEGLSQVEDKRISEQYLADCMRRRQREVVSISAASYRQLLQAADEDDVVIITTLNAQLDRRQIDLMQDLLHSRRKVIGIAVGGPYDLLAFPLLGTYLATYEYTQPALEAAVRVLFGEIQPRGRLPVSLPGLYERG